MSASPCGRWLSAPNSGWRRRSTRQRSALRDLSAHLKSATLSEADSKALLREAGIALPDEVLVTEKSALDAAIARTGFPLVMKIQSPDIPHKSEVGGVRVNITTKGEVFLAYEKLMENARRHRPDAAIQGVLVGPMAKKGVEIIIGTMCDATFGPMIMVGFGGITTELFRDVIYRPAPVSADEATAMLAELKAAPLLSGFRGAAKADIAALSQLISQISVLAAACRDHIAEIELNPVLVHAEGQGVTIVDALVVPEVVARSPDASEAQSGTRCTLRHSPGFCWRLIRATPCSSFRRRASARTGISRQPLDSGSIAPRCPGMTA